LLALEVNTLESEEGEFWTEGGIDAERNLKRTRAAAPCYLKDFNACAAGSDTPIREMVSMA